VFSFSEVRTRNRGFLQFCLSSEADFLTFFGDPFPTSRTYAKKMLECHPGYPRGRGDRTWLTLEVTGSIPDQKGGAGPGPPLVSSENPAGVRRPRGLGCWAWGALGGGRWGVPQHHTGKFCPIIQFFSHDLCNYTFIEVAMGSNPDIKTFGSSRRCEV
jgi:hypothetical protein